MADPRTTAVRVKAPIGQYGGGFMISREAKAVCEEYGLGARELYFRGRCGVLGECDADVVTSVAVFFPPEYVEENWNGGRKLPTEQAVELYAGICAAWGRRRLGDYDGCARIAELLEPVVRQASSIGAPLFAGWRAVPLPDDAPARATQLMHVVRELRGGLHANAVVAQGLHPLQATLAADHDATPFGQTTGELIARFFAWPEPYAEPDPDVVARRSVAEEATDDLMASVFSPLNNDESDELIELLRFGHAR
ncbi:SCO6745 family protein [Nonomuraea sp. LPB2021202275-12-8]|uniref:SCO6745 family protein n=1 Tax=Nonomuraea sp. LPB2021202275-12-8 TaxID=3120159 RepID=UPI00300CAB4C